MGAQRGMRWTFRLSAGTLVHAYAVFPAVAALRAVLRPRPLRASGGTPPVSVIVAAHDEAGVIARKVENTLALGYPANRLELVIASDGSTDGTDDIVRRCDDARVRLLALPRGGKNAALNAAVAAARGEILVFSDADASLEPHALRALVAPFADPAVGAVAGERRQAGHRDNARKRAVWSAKRGLRRTLSRAGSATAGEGQLHAIRRELFEAVPRDVNDDFFISAGAIARGRRLVYAPDAVSEPFAGSTALRAPFARKVRLTRRWLRALWWRRELLDPSRHGFYALQLLSHKLLRRLVAIPLLGLAISAPALMRRGRLPRAATLAQVAVHGAAALGLAVRARGQRGPRLVRAALRFDMANAAALVALADIARGRGDAHREWTPQRPAAEPSDGPADPVRARGDLAGISG